MDEALSQHIAKLASSAGSASVQSPCFQKGWQGFIESMNVTGSGNYDNCYSAVSDVLKVVANSCPEKTTCMFAGIPRPPLSSVVGLSALFYTRKRFDLDEDATLSAYESAGKAHCAVNYNQPENADAHLDCFYAAYIVNFLRRGLGLSDTSDLKIMDSHDNMSISFSRGAVLAVLADLWMTFEHEAFFNVGHIAAMVALTVIFLTLIIVLICCCVRTRMKAKQDERKRQELMQDWDGDGEPELAEPAGQDAQQPEYDFFGPPEEHHVGPVLQEALEVLEDDPESP
jgi:hypothetical protein